MGNYDTNKVKYGPRYMSKMPSDVFLGDVLWTRNVSGSGSIMITNLHVLYSLSTFLHLDKITHLL